jgi:anaphase-promoting complex subunit 4
MLQTGQFLAVGWSDGVVRLMGLETNKPAHHIPVCKGANTDISHIGWATCNVTSKAVMGLPTHLSKGELPESAASEDNLPPNLPQELTFLEVDTALPKLSPLPTGSAGAE